jgi:hypothetical protein
MNSWMRRRRESDLVEIADISAVEIVLHEEEVLMSGMM